MLIESFLETNKYETAGEALKNGRFRLFFRLVGWFQNEDLQKVLPYDSV